ncbi:MAG: serine hydrolase [Acidobacteriota bacterium]|nr:serine hydrolase [Acidobacteriota bacterium]
MKNKVLRSSLFLLLLIFPVFTFAQTLDERLKEIDAYAEKTRTDWNVPGMAIAIVKDDKVVFAKGYGVRELGKTDEMKIDQPNNDFWFYELAFRRSESKK